jgi:ABC-type hemin transport system substrate-binding protein
LPSRKQEAGNGHGWHADAGSHLRASEATPPRSYACTLPPSPEDAEFKAASPCYPRARRMPSPISAPASSASLVELAALTHTSPDVWRPIVSLSPAITDTLFSLGASHRIAGARVHRHHTGAAHRNGTAPLHPHHTFATFLHSPECPWTGEVSHNEGVQAPPPPLRRLVHFLQRLVPQQPPPLGGRSWSRTARRVAERSSDWQPLHEVHISKLQELNSPLILTWEPEQEGCGAVLSAIEPCHIGTLDQVGSADLDADMVTIAAPRTLSALCDSIACIGAVIGHEEAAAATITALRCNLRSIAAQCRSPGCGPPKRFVSLRGVSPCILTGGWLPELVALAGGELLDMEAGTGACAVSWQHVASLKPDVLLLLVEGASMHDALGEVGILAEQPGWWTVPAVVANAVYVADAGDMLCAGPGVLRALTAIAKITRPDLALACGCPLPAFQLAMKPRQRCRGAFLPDFFREVTL